MATSGRVLNRRPVVVWTAVWRFWGLCYGLASLGASEGSRACGAVGAAVLGDHDDPKVRGPAGQLALPFSGTTTIAERPRIETDRVALGPIDTSREAAVSVQEHVAESRRLVLALIRGSEEKGCTCDEIAAAMGRDPNQVSGRFTELDRMGLIVRSGHRRPTRKGRAAHVWVARVQS